MHEYWHVILESLIDTAKILPLLFVVYYLIEWFEYRNAIKMLIANGAKRLYNCKIEDVLYSHKDGEIIVDFVLEDPIKDYIAEDVFELDYIPIKSKNISIPFDVVFRTLIEDEELECICSYIVDCPEALKVILQGGAIDIIQQDLPYGAE